VCICTLPRVLQLRTPPSCSGGLWCCHMLHISGSRLPTRKGSSATTYHTAPDLAFLLGRALVLSYVPRFWIPPYCSRGLQCYHVSHGFEPSLPIWGRGEMELRRCHVSRKPQRVTSLKSKKRLSCNGIQQGSHVSKTRPCVTEATVRRADIRHLSLPINRVDMHYNTVLQCSATCLTARGRGW
jgi:hypothetical protein